MSVLHPEPVQFSCFCRCRYLHDNLLTGALPAEWGTNYSFTVLKTLTLGGNNFSTTLPPEWGTPDGWAVLQSLNLSRAGVEGTLPEAWAGGFPALKTL